MDKNTLIACLFVLISWLAWDAYMRKKYPKTDFAQKNSIEAPLVKQLNSHGSFNQDIRITEDIEQRISYQNSDLYFTLSSQGMGFTEYRLKQVLDRKGEAVWIFRKAKDPTKAVKQYYAFETRLVPQEILYFKIHQVEPGVFKGVANKNGLRITKTLEVVPTKDFLIHSHLEFKGNLQQLSEVHTFLVPYVQKEVKKSKFSFLSPMDFLSFFIFSGTQGAKTFSFYPEDLSNGEDYIKKPTVSALEIAAVGEKYFGQAWIDKSNVEPSFRFVDKKHLVGKLKHLALDSNNFSLSYHIFMGPKALHLLSDHHSKLVEWVDFGWFGFLARFILRVLNFFYSLVQNWGLSIILLTLMVRFLLLPLVLSSHRSMEVMKLIQPEIKKIRERFKQDPKRMNQEVMALMRAHKANPLGGCLPMLLQIPVFWALWKALGSSYSLYRSPFIFWIQDLSWKDPFYILPAAIGGLMFIQQKLTPVSVNPEMAKAMQFLPIVISVFMVNLPSGLTLYVFVSSLFGLVQQLYINSASSNRKILTNIKKEEK